MVNRCIMIGNLGQDPEVKHLDGGTTLATFSVATSESYKNKAGERVTDTQWHNIVVWGKLAEIVEKFLKKGSKVYLEGKLTHRSYEDKEGVKKYMTEVVCHNMTMLDKKEDGGTQTGGEEIPPRPQQQQQVQQEENLNPEGGDSDLPF